MDKFERYRMQPMESEKDVWKRAEYVEVQNDRESNPRAGAIVRAFGNYRKTHPLIKFKHRIQMFIQRLRYGWSYTFNPLNSDWK